MVEEGKRREKQGAVEEKGKRSGNLPLLPNPFASRLGSDQVIMPFLYTDYSSAQVFRVMTRVMDPLAAAAAVLLVVLVVLVVLVLVVVIVVVIVVVVVVVLVVEPQSNPLREKDTERIRLEQSVQEWTMDM